MMILTKMALVTCAFYVGIAILLEALLLGVSLWKHSMMYSLNFKVQVVIFGMIWLTSFVLAWRVTIVPFLD